MTAQSGQERTLHGLPDFRMDGDLGMEASMFIFFVVFLVTPSALFLIGAAVFQSVHLLISGLVMALVSGIFYPTVKGARSRADARRDSNQRWSR